MKWTLWIETFVGFPTADFTRCIRCRSHRGPWLWCRLGAGEKIHDPWWLWCVSWCQGFLGNLGDTPLKTLQCFQLRQLEPTNFVGFFSAKPLRWRQPAEDPRKLGKYVNTGAEQEPLGDWVQGPPPLCRSFLCCQSSKGLNHKNAMEMTVQDFPRLKWIIHRPTLRHVLRLLKQEDPGGLLTPCFFLQHLRLLSMISDGPLLSSYQATAKAFAKTFLVPKRWRTLDIFQQVFTIQSWRLFFAYHVCVRSWRNPLWLPMLCGYFADYSYVT